jgi:hypothetical protein
MVAMGVSASPAGLEIEANSGNANQRYGAQPICGLRR